ncbi:hypothetical protein EDC04DRAFT_349386 [Pisolithus marmoratus]|nr:hypothetical protein EDC04DRAFT_349386 [Pisolithus marmoratus]
MQKTKNAFLVASCDFEHLNRGIAASLDCKKREDNNGGASGVRQCTSTVDYERWIRRLDRSQVSEGLLGSTCTNMRISQERLSVSNSGIYCQVAFAQYYAQSKNRKNRWRNEPDMSHRVALPCVSTENVITGERRARTSSFRYPSVGLVK